MLLERPGKMGTREELRAKLWATDTFVDFDHGLNSAVQRLRDCLSDSAGKPLWVETIPRRGYRFVGQVEWSDEGFSSEILSPAVNFAGTYAQLGRKEETIRYLEESYRERSPDLVFLQKEPNSDFVHSDPRYRATVKKMGLPPAY